MTDYQSLRELAEKATPGPWHVTTGGDYQEVRTRPEMRAPEIIWDGAHQNADGDWIDSPDIHFIAAANPQTILCLLDALKSKDHAAVWDEAITKAASLLWAREKRNKNDQDLAAELGAARAEIRDEPNPYRAEEA